MCLFTSAAIRLPPGLTLQSKHRVTKPLEFCHSDLLLRAFPATICSFSTEERSSMHLGQSCMLCSIVAACPFKLVKAPSKACPSLTTCILFLTSLVSRGHFFLRGPCIFNTRLAIGRRRILIKQAVLSSGFELGRRLDLVPGRVIPYCLR